MSDVIKLLPDSVANQIAAGEVIQRPASVVKELVENAVDAGATEIQVIIKDAGRTLVQVVDNGCGMSATDARLAFERHSTSKIRQADDLFALHTMGFRGEALASICAVSQVDLRTMRADDKIGTRILINGSKIESQVPEACAKGSNMMVKNLFFNVPARRKFLKKDAVEMSNILHEFERLALVNPELELTLIHNDVTLHRLPPANMRRRIVDLFGKQLNDKLIPVDTDTDLVRIHGFIVRPEHCRKRNALQYLFVNGRNMRHPYFHKAITQTYEGLIPADEQPTYFLNFTVDPSSIDVNIHPTKNEIKFEQEQTIRQILFAVVKETLGRFSAAPEIDFSTLTDAGRLDIPAPGSHTAPVGRPSAINGGYNPFRAPSASNWEELYQNFTSAKSEAIAQAPAPSSGGEQSMLNGLEGDASDLNDARPTLPPTILPLGRRYAAMADPRGVRVIDLCRAHRTVIYHRLMETFNAGETFSSQRLIFPDRAALGTVNEPIIQDLEPQLTAIGFDIAPLGGGEWSINAVPSIADSANPAELLSAIVAEAAEKVEAANAPLTGTLQQIAMGMARASAFKGDRLLSETEINHIVSQLLSLPAPGFTPGGKPTFTVISEQDIAAKL
ncbi:MAG: DNA mismatch repair endonuclease MutL [Muribaculaceae bacterium]|nr:DNA mismatch repair endonuclease MutL [Muribaculaceae bacterium]